ncbi:MAG: hypothetical protein ABJB86_21635 [Bacteroidota bacterium]
MKKERIIILFSIVFSLTQLSTAAQDSTRHGAIKQINKTSAQTDNLNGKKIQQQSLSGNHIERLDSVSATTSKTKSVVKRKRKKS